MGLFVIAGEEVGFDEILFAFLERAKPLGKIRFALGKQRPPREEVQRAPF
ncbi:MULTISPECIES: hypothetical protein [Mesorhizobium]|nr:MULTISPECIES: hypothetical protein [Mesorhizobium]MBZ9975132.1 hypothetical protein [Mesorhizobium sp. BR-1-1-10]